LPGNNVEFNSSALSADHVKVKTLSLDMSQVIPVPANQKGICVDRTCSDYDGPTGGGEEDMGGDGMSSSVTSSIVAASTSRQAMGIQTSTSTSVRASAKSSAIDDDAENMVALAGVTATVTETVTGKSCSTSKMRKRRIDYE
jgi:hypothetical protein